MVLSKTCGIFSIAFAYYRVAGTLTSRADIERALVSIKSLKWCALKSDVMFGRWWGKANEVETNPKKRLAECPIERHRPGQLRFSICFL